jgi:putative membrane protein
MTINDFWLHMGSLWAFAISGILLMFVGYWVFDRLTPRIDFAKELVDNKNVAVALMVASIILGVAIIVAATILPTPPTQGAP